MLDIKSDDVCLTLTSGGDNSLNLLLHGARQVVSVDCNPAQSALLEMKVAAVRSVCLLACAWPMPFMLQSHNLESQGVFLMAGSNTAELGCMGPVP